MINHSRHHDWGVSYADWLIRGRWPLALIGLLSLACAVPIASSLNFDRSVESLFASNDPDLLSYQKFQRFFGGHSAVLLVYQDSDLATQSGMERNRLIAGSIAEIPGVADVLSFSRLSDAMDRFRPSFTSSEIPNLFRDDDQVARGFASLFSNYTHSSDRSRAAIVVLLDQQSVVQSISALKEIRDSLTFGSFFSHLKNDHSDKEKVCLDAALVGESVMIGDGLNLIERDGKRLAILTVALLGFVVFLTLADLRFVLLAAVSILWTVVVTQAILVGIGWQLSIASSVLTAIVTVIAVTAVLHLGVFYRSQRWRGQGAGKSAFIAISRLARPVFWTGLTDAVGFFALSVSDLTPIAQFGCMIAIASLGVLVSLSLFVGVVMGISVSPWMTKSIDASSSVRTQVGGFTRKLTTIQEKIDHHLRRLALRSCSVSMQHGNVLICLSMVGGAAALWGLRSLETERSFLNNFGQTSSISLAYQEVESHFGGAGVWDVMIEAPRELTDEYLNQVLQLEDALREIEVEGARLTKVLSLADAELVVRRSRFAAFLPVNARLSFMNVALPGFFDALISSPERDHRYIRVMLRSREDLEPSQRAGLISEVRRVVESRTESEKWQRVSGGSKTAEVTGYYLLLSRLIDQLIIDQWRCFLASSLLVGSLLWWVTRSLKLALVSMFPNLLPILSVLALCGLFGQRLNMGAAMIAAVSIGISIDASVHLLLRFQEGQQRGRTVYRSIQYATSRIGVPVILSTIALVVGFGALSTSEFVPTATFGLLIAITMVLGAVVNLTLLPAFLYRANRSA
ncbi:MMPL family transporter [Rhodopirellula sp.]|nr:MMPL family transporter [Rhodopirellula sp.]MDB4679131.1 MMPL family transporter [Rhodopirellula sp.]